MTTIWTKYAGEIGRDKCDGSGSIQLNNHNERSTCKNCDGKGFTERGGLFKESKGDVFKCPRCSFKTSDDDKWQHHMEEHDEADILYKEAELEFANYTDKDYERLGLKWNDDHSELVNLDESQFQNKEVFNNMDSRMNDDDYENMAHALQDTSDNLQSDSIDKAQQSLNRAIEDTTINPEETAVDRAGQLMRDQKATSNFWEDSQKSKVPQGQGHKWQRHGEVEDTEDWEKHYNKISEDDDYHDKLTDTKHSHTIVDLSDADEFMPSMMAGLHEEHEQAYIEKFGEDQLDQWCPTCEDEGENCVDPDCNLNHCPDCEETNANAKRKTHDQLDDEFWKGVRGESKANEYSLDEEDKHNTIRIVRETGYVGGEVEDEIEVETMEEAKRILEDFRADAKKMNEENEDEHYTVTLEADESKTTEDFDSYNLGNPKDDLEKPTSADQRIADTQESGQVDTDPNWKSGRFRRGGSWADKKDEWDKSQGEVKEVIDDTEKDEIFQYLFELQSSGKTNMFGSIPWVQGEFPHLDVKEVKAVVMEWMQNYQEIHDRMGIDFI